MKDGDRVFRTTTRSGYTVSTLYIPGSYGGCNFETAVLDRMGHTMDETCERDVTLAEAERRHVRRVQEFTEAVGYDANGSPCEVWP